MMPNLKDHRGHAVIETSLMLLSGHYSWCILVLENLDHVNVFTTEFGNSRHFCAGMRFNQVSEYILAHNATCRRNEDAAIIPGQLLLPKDYLLYGPVYGQGFLFCITRWWGIKDINGGRMIVIEMNLLSFA